MLRARLTLSVAAALLSLSLGCSRAPDLAPVEAAFGPDRPGTGGQPRVSTRLAGTPFGTRIARAVETNPELAASTAALRSARAQRRGVSGAFLPEVSLGLTTRTDRIGSQSVSETRPEVRVRQLVYDGGASGARRTAAAARVLQSQGTRLESASEIALQAVEAYYGLRSQRRLLAVAKNDLSVHRRIAGQIEDRSASGAGTRSDVLTARSRLSDAKARVARAQSDLDRAQAEFRRVFGRSPEGVGDPPSAPALPDLETERIVADSPRIRSFRAQIKAAEAELAAARAGRLPTVSADATGGPGDNDQAEIGFGLSLNYDLASRGERAARIESAAAQVEGLRAQAGSLKREIRRSLDFLRSDRTTGDAQVAAARRSVEANADRLDAVREQFGIGRSTLIELLDTQRDTRSAREVLIRAERERAVTDYAALALTGDILDAFAITLGGEEAS